MAYVMAYVYAILVDGIPRYYGKGTRNRAFSHMWEVRSIARRRAAGDFVQTSRFYSLLTDAWLAGATVEPAIVAEGLTHRQALDLEEQLIELGGDSVWNERRPGKMTDKQRANHLAYMQTPEEFARKSAMAKRLWQDPDYAERVLAAVGATNQTTETKERRSKAIADVWANSGDEARKARCEALSAAAKKRYANSLVQQILAFISGAADGATYVDVSQALGVDRKKLIPGINRLCKQHLIDDRSGGRNGRFYRTNMDVTAAIPNRKIPSGADRSASLKTTWERRTAENDAKVLAFIDEKNPSMKDLKAMFGRKVMGWITKLIERGLIERRGGYHNCNFYRTNILQMETA